MSTVLPPAAALLLPVLGLLLLQPAAAMAIAARAAIAVVRLMFFLSYLGCPAAGGALTGPVWAHGLRQPGGGRCTGALTAVGPPRESIPTRIPGRANVVAGTPAAPCWRSAELSGVDLPNFC